MGSTRFICYSMTRDKDTVEINILKIIKYLAYEYKHELNRCGNPFWSLENNDIYLNSDRDIPNKLRDEIARLVEPLYHIIKKYGEEFEWESDRTVVHIKKNYYRWGEYYSAYMLHFIPPKD